ncbi:Methyltransferase type 11 [Penicillium paradoxum]|uniref:Methyltransferase type 11 n=1 Tax=Penicillium paradoxum TaxID=176176 RepID=UPI002547776F|nr:Methyltransferase type 11 [Penicillium paradoxum]KAJ5788454.1 Methyltransferase type 11 [Penicillium paradoxum]
MSTTTMPTSEIAPAPEYGFNAKQGVNWSDYVTFRPIYPPSFFEEVFTYHAQKSHATWSIAQDIGAGCGIVSSSLAPRFNKVIVSDPNEGYTALARKVLVEQSQLPESKFRFLQESAEKSSVESGSVDLIMACECIHWTRPEIAIKEFARELRVGGTLVITHYNYPRIEGNERAQRAWEAVCGFYAGEVNDPMLDHALRILNSGMEALGFPTGDWEGVKRLYINAQGRIEAFRINDRVGESQVKDGEEIVWEEDVEDWMDEQDCEWFKGYASTWTTPDVAESEINPLWDEMERAFGGKKVKTATPLAMVFATKRNG